MNVSLSPLSISPYPLSLLSPLSLPLGEEKAIASSLTFSGQPSPSLPEVQKITGEEGERHVMQVRTKCN